uniref:CAZy families GH18 protein n=1 Tax=uncultured Thermobifida sp. TaxID=671178 RepID=A0A060CJP2_9ACTN|nr:CAZy families GH18 protein [uncultured Thermobifida sp.]
MIYVAVWTNITGHHANLYAYPQENGALSANQAVKQLLSHHVPANKVVVGAAAYSRDWYTFDEPIHNPLLEKLLTQMELILRTTMT